MYWVLVATAVLMAGLRSMVLEIPRFSEFVYKRGRLWQIVADFRAFFEQQYTMNGETATEGPKIHGSTGTKRAAERRHARAKNGSLALTHC